MPEHKLRTLRYLAIDEIESAVQIVPSIDKDTHGFDGQKNAHAASKPLPIHKVLPAGFSLPERFSAPAKLLAPDSDGFLV